MNNFNSNEINSQSASHPIQLGDRIWWVGHYLEGDSFQCHPYLIENGDQSVLLDPGSVLTFKQTLKKIEEIIPFTKIRYFICHHQDPDITGALHIVDTLNVRNDACIVTHWRAEALLKHYALKIPFYRIEEHDWQLDLSDRTLRFVYTPYLHFPGAFVTFDTAEGVLFSSDLFGGFSEEWSLIAKNENIFEGIRIFHEHYMPAREILTHSLRTIEELPLKMIAPQHGSIIPEHLIGFIINKLKGIDCGLYLLSENETEIHRLSRMNKMLRDIMETMIIYRDFHDIAGKLLDIAGRVLPVNSLEFYALGDDGNILHISPENRYRAINAVLPKEYEDFMGMDRDAWLNLNNELFLKIKLNSDAPGILIPLFSPESNRVRSVALFRLHKEIPSGEEIVHLLKHINTPLEVAVERELIHRKLDLERQAVYEQSIRDPLTGLFNRIYMHDMIDRVMNIHDRDEQAGVAVIIIDVDHFKQVNDSFGHTSGDEVLKKMADILKSKSRKSDLPVRYGGEEFALFIIGQSSAYAPDTAERIREDVENMRLTGNMADYKVTISSGVALRTQGESLSNFIQRADRELYRAKNSGRNRVCIAEQS